MDTLLSSKIRTREERDKLVSGIADLKKSLFEGKDSEFSIALNSKVPAWASEIIKKEMKGDPKVYLDAVSNILIALKPLKLIIAFQPTETTIDKLSKYLEGSYILDFEYDPKIIGGAVIISKGEYRDYSLQKTIWKTLEAI